MKKGRATGCTIIAGFVLVFAIAFAHASPVVTLELAGDLPLSVGQTIEVQVVADVGPLAIAAFGFDVTGDPQDISFNGAIVAPHFLDTSQSFENTDVAGIRSPMGGIVTGNDVLLASLFFTINQPGRFSVGIFSDLSDLSDLNEGLFFPYPTPRIDMSTTLDLNIAVPLPPGILLLGSGLATLLVFWRKM